jgi:hypothetical integral membrane protein (TIGR02206 family)
MKPSFQPFGLHHLAADLVVFTMIGVLVFVGRKKSEAQRWAMGRAFGLVLLGYYLAESILRVFYLRLHWPIIVPLELCSALFFIGAYAYFTGSRLAFECVYFWTMAGTIHAFITPTPRAGFPDIEFFQYFAAHGLLVASALFAVFVLGQRPTRGSVLRAFGALLAFELAVAIIDAITGQNYLYLRQKPPSPTLVDALGPWPVYIAAGTLVGLLSFIVLDAPFFLSRTLAARRARITSTQERSS